MVSHHHQNRRFLQQCLRPQQPRALLVGLAASVGAGISMAFAEEASDDGSLTGRGKPLLRGFVCGLMTTAGGIGHTLPYLIPNFRTATAIAVVIVAIELLLISWIRKRFMDTPFLRAAFQVIVSRAKAVAAIVHLGRRGQRAAACPF